MTEYVHVNGELTPATDATVSVQDRGFLYGDGVFETIRVYGGSAFAWDAHMDRLHGSCAVLGLEHTVTDAELEAWMHEVLEANGYEDAYVRISITRGAQPGRLTPAREVDPTIVILVEPLPRGGTSGLSTWDTPATVTIADIERMPDASIPAHAKTLNYLNGILARLEARTAQVDEALMVDAAGLITEGATSNVFLVRDEVLYTPATDTSPVLPGITRATVMDLAEELSIPVEQTHLYPRDVRDADEVFLTNTTSEVWPVASIDEEEYPVGPITETLAEAFDTYVEEHHYG